MQVDDFALVALKLLIFKVYVIIGISKIEIFDFSGTERVKNNRLAVSLFLQTKIYFF